MDEFQPHAYSTIQETQLRYWEKIRHPFVAGLELTPRCNLRCVHCYLQDYKTASSLATEEWLTVIDKLYEAGVLILYMTGGEIFTRKDFPVIYRHAKQKGFIIELLTNVTCMTEEIFDVLNKYPPSTVSISVYGMHAETYEAVTGVKGSFDKFMANLRKLCDADIDVELKFIGLKENIADFQAARDFAAELGVKFKFNFEIFPTLEGDVDLSSHCLKPQEILEIEKGDESIYRVIAANVLKRNPYRGRTDVPLYTCNVASTLCLVDCMGYVNPCNKMRLKKYNLLTGSLHEIWEKLIEEYAFTKAPPEYKCAQCENIVICSPCPAINKLSTGESHIPCPASCELTHLRVEEFSKKKYDQYRNE